MANWLLITTPNGRSSAGEHYTKNLRLKENVFNVKGKYRAEVGTVQVGDQLVVLDRYSRASASEKDDVVGLYKVTRELYENRYAKRHGQDTYCLCIGIGLVKESVYPQPHVRGILDYHSYPDENITTNFIKRISDNEYSLFEDAIDLWTFWQKYNRKIGTLEIGYDGVYLFPLKFDTKWKVDTKLDSSGILEEYHFKEFNLLRYYLRVFLRLSKIKIILYGFNDGRLKFYGHAEVRSIDGVKGAKNEKLLKLTGYKDFYSPRSEKLIELAENGVQYWLKNVYPVQRISDTIFLLLIDEEIEHLTSIILDDDNIIESNIQENIDLYTSEGETLRHTRIGQAALRNVALRIYSNQCALCDIKDSELLEASHIARWSKDLANRGRAQNVICMCIVHHRLFELGRFFVEDDYTVRFSPQFSEQCKDCRSFEAILKSSRHKLRLPENERYHPDLELLRNHREQFNEGNDID